MIDIAEVDRNRSAFAFIPTQGYVRLGEPPIPDAPKGPETACEPLPMANAGSWHRLQPPGGHGQILAQWWPSSREWAPPLGAMGNRVGFRSKYLAAHGWTYGEPV